MKSLDESPTLRLGTLCLLYCAQGIPFGFLTVTVAAYLAERGVSSGDIGHLLAMCSLPWALKWLWGPIIDRFSFDRLGMGRRRPWILLAQCLMMLTLVLVVLLPDLTQSMKMLGWIVFVHNVFASLQDVSSDALAVDLLAEKERGKANGIMYGSSYFGSFIGGAGLGLIASRSGLAAAMTVQLCMLGAIMVAPLLLKEHASNRRFPWSKAGNDVAPEKGENANASLAELLAHLFKAFRLRSPLIAAGLALVTMIGSSMMAAVFVVYMTRNLGWTQEEYSTVIGGKAVFFGLSGAVLGGFLADKIGQKRLAALASVLLGVCWIVMSCTEARWLAKDYVSAMAYIEAFLAATMSVSLFSLFMSVSWPVVAGTQFTAYMALLNVSRTVGSWLASPFEDVPVPTLFLGAGILQIAVIGLLWFIDPSQSRRVLGDGQVEEPPEHCSAHS